MTNVGEARPGKVPFSSFGQTSKGVLEKYGGKRSQQILTGLALAQMLHPPIKWGIERYKKKESFAISIQGTDHIYEDLHTWVLERIPKANRKALLLGSDKFNGDLKVFYDGSTPQLISVEGITVVVQVVKESMEGFSIGLERRRELESLVFTANSIEGRDAIIRVIEKMVEEKHQEEVGLPDLYMPSRWGSGWVSRGDMPKRSMESIILKDGQLERLMDDLDGFMSGEEDYNRLSQPWHRGYLFHGAPGTGKTSVARALADHFGMDTFYLPLGDLRKDSNLVELVAGITPRSLLLIEDIDVYHGATERTEEKESVSLSAMLNALDGIWTPHGLITIMTTNDKEALDPALIRAGRIDVDEEFSELDLPQAKNLAMWIEGSDTLENQTLEEFAGKSPAELIKYLRERQQDEKDSERAIGSGGSNCAGHDDPPSRSRANRSRRGRSIEARLDG